jgi:hypothetical protein
MSWAVGEGGAGTKGWVKGFMGLSDIDGGEDAERSRPARPSSGVMYSPVAPSLAHFFSTYLAFKYSTR